VRGRLADLSLETVGDTTEAAAEYTRQLIGMIDAIRDAVMGPPR